jgi:ABC-2 type transport system permease protein
MRPEATQPIRRGAAGMRLRGLVRKELLQVLRDPSSIAIAFVMPTVLLFLFGYGVSLDAKHVPLAIVVEQPSAETADLAAAFRSNEYFRPIFFSDMAAASRALLLRQVDAIVHLREDFARELRAPGGAPIQVIVNGVDANNARLMLSYIQGAWAKWLEQRAQATGVSTPIPVRLESQVWFNRELRSRDFLVPGLVALIMTLIGALLTALVMAREWERGTMEALLVTPVRMREIVVSKIVTYFLLGMGGMLLSVAMSIGLFDVPLRGSFVVLAATSALFLLVALGMGLLISVATKNQFVASQVAIIVTFLPAFLLSGFIFDISSMPKVVQVITHLLAARYFVSILQTVFLAGDIWRVILPNALALAVMAVIFMALVRRKAKKSLE